MIFCTSVCLNHLAKAKVLANSLKEHMPESKLVICLLEKSLPAHLLDDQDFHEVVLAKDMGFTNFETTIFKYNQYEAACACKGQLMKYVYSKYKDVEFFSYIDSDTQVFSRFDEVFAAFKTHSIVLTPHYNEPPKNTYTIWGENAEILILRVGIINGGYIGVKRSMEAEAMLDWWTARLERYAFNDAEQGLFTDQRWLTAALMLFDKIYVLKHDGYNVAFWNINQRNISMKDGVYYANGEPFRFFHFSTLHFLRDNLPDNPSIYKVVHQYIALMEENENLYPTHFEWSYNFFDHGERIVDKSRSVFKYNSELEAHTTNPYALTNKAIKRLKIRKTQVRKH
ncbi:hypothetical protein LCY76_09255 [Fictibacillus sp. KIGAM418]|uniref:Glycosyl transferase n=1 Tax=Fictibacillus marinisediminis TaxID=2878389 RepID=A0A9X2BCQ2_9BACL|nr:hypothetical protein [Fictibacillus marinisediminis]MCK6256781.1 hypothetical protein [Fictibacillus marinisediminis]